MKLSRAEIKDVCLLTPMQQGMLHHALLAPDSPAYHEQLLARFDGPLDLARLREAWQRVIDRHDALRGLFLCETTSRPAQAITHRQEVRFETWQSEASDSAAGALPAAMESCLAVDRAKPFDLTAGHAMRWTVWQETPDRHWLLWSFHHILLDGWSIGLVLEEVLAAYRQLAQGEPVLPEPAPPYGRYQRWLAERQPEPARAFWQATLEGCEPAHFVASLAGEDQAPAKESIVIAPEHFARLSALAARERATLAHLLIAAWGLAMGNRLGRADVTVGTVMAGRPPEIEGIERMAGLFIATLPLRLRWQPGDSFAALLRQARDAALAAAPHAHLPLPDILAGVPEGNALIDTLLLVQALPYEDVLGPIAEGLSLAQVEFREETPFALELAATPGTGSLMLCWKGRGVGAALPGLARGMQALLDAVAENPDLPLSELDCVPAEERAQLLAWGDGGASPEPRATILDLFARQVNERPDAAALVAEDGAFTYRELDSAANRLAHTLRHRLTSADFCSGRSRLTGLQPVSLHESRGGTQNSHRPTSADFSTSPRIALVAERRAELLVGLLAILKAGAAYVPVDPDFPADRVALMLEDSGCVAVLASRSLVGDLSAPAGVPVIGLDEVDASLPDSAPDVAVGPDSLAYLIYTSGSTGRPKGTRLFHRNAASFFAALPQAFGFAPGQRLLAITTVSFDIAGLELLGALACGMTVVLASAATARDPARIVERIGSERVEVLQSTPTRLKLLVEQAGIASLAALRTVLVGGEALPQDLADQLSSLPDTAVFNVYGPTETTIWSAACRVTPGPVSLGRALPGEKLFVLSSHKRLQPIGAVGELAIAGDGVGGAYHQRPELSAERFPSITELCEGPVYLTGDLARWLPDGRLEFLGRSDGQIKIRGMRIEPAEIEQWLRRYPGVRDAVVVAVKNDRGFADLVAYLAADAAPDIAECRTFLAKELPEPCLPSLFVTLPALPQTPNGKIDRRALPKPEPITVSSAPTSSREPANPREQAILAAFAAVLATPIGPEDDFFQHGGHSLSAMQAIGRINRELKSQYRLRDLYLARTAAALALREAAGEAIPPAPEQADYPLSAAQESLWVLQQQAPEYSGYNVPGAYRLRGRFDPTAFRAAWAALTQRHESLRTVFALVDGEPRQRVLPDLPAEWHEEDLTGQPATAIASRVAALTAAPFDLATGPLFRLAWLRTADDAGILLLAAHHAITDGWSDQVLACDLAAAYRAAIEGQPIRLPPPPACRYRDFAHWQHQRLAGDWGRTQAEAWRQRLLRPEPAPPLQLPADGPRSTGLDRPCGRVPFALAGESGQRWLAAVGPERRGAALLAAVQTLLYVASGQGDLVVGLPVAGRERPELQEQVGLHLNMLPLRHRLDPAQPLSVLAAQDANVLADALARADYPFARLVADLGLAAPAGRHPVFDTMLIFHQHAVPRLDLPGVDAAPEPALPACARFDLDVEVWANDDGLTGFIEYDAGLFSAARAAGFAAHLQAILAALAEAPEQTPETLRTALTGVSAQDEANRFLADSLALDEEF